MTAEEKNLIKMKHKLGRLKIILERFELAVIDEDVYQMSNQLTDMAKEIKNEYRGMEITKNDKNN